MSYTPSPYLKERYFCREMPQGYFSLVPAGTLRQTPFPSASRHNACWDFLLCRDGVTGYVALCGELSQPLCARLFRYDTRSGELTFLFDLGQVFCVNPREIPPSKIHTSLAELPDGRIVMTTHTTARSPRHPYWLFDSYFEHLHEGYAGSHVLIYDPRDGKVANLGIPVKRDSIYGSCYDEAHNALFFTTFLRGDIFRMSLDTLEVTPLGQITEFGSYCLFSDHCGGIYTSSRSGHVFRVDTETLEVRDLGPVASEPEPVRNWNLHRVIAHVCQGPDGAFYFTMHFSDKLFRLDPATRAITQEADLSPRGDWRDAPPGIHKGHVFDSQGVLWFIVARESVNDYPGGAAHLYRYDYRHGQEVEFMGLLGADHFSTAMICHVALDANDTLHYPNGNHGEDMAWMVSLDLREVYRRRHEERPLSRDPWNYCAFADGAEFYPGKDFAADSADYFRFRQYMQDDAAWRDAHARSQVRPDPCGLCRLWELLPPQTDHTIHTLHYREKGVWEAIAGGVRFLVSPAGTLLRQDPAPDARPRPQELPRLPQELPLPARAGRGMLATITAAVAMAGGKWLLGSADSLFSLWDPRDNSLFSLGAVGSQGPVRAMAVSQDGKVAFALCGDDDDLGHLARFSLKEGLQDLGRVFGATPGNPMVANNPQLASLAVNPDGSLVAVGGAGRLATLFFFRFP